MITLRRSSERGYFDHGWLKTYHTFSFGQYQDPQYVGYRNLRVINEDFVQPGKGFATHSHQNMEILTYVLEGVLAHKDSLGNGSEIRPGEIQKMSAGTGISHSEYNASTTEICHLLQIWIHPGQRDLAPSYDQKSIAAPTQSPPWSLLASPDGRDGSVLLHQDARVWAAKIAPGQQAVLPLSASRYGWLQVARGKVEIEGRSLGQGDAAAVSHSNSRPVLALTPAEVLFFDLA